MIVVGRNFAAEKPSPLRADIAQPGLVSVSG
jgi:hypothetical protein